MWPSFSLAYRLIHIVIYANEARRPITGHVTTGHWDAKPRGTTMWQTTPRLAVSEVNRTGEKNEMDFV